MSGISLSHFLEVARLGTDGEVRIASGTENRLVAKGMLEHRLGTFLGMGDETTRSARNEAAISKFREAMAARFGTHTAEEALKLAGHQANTPLTGRVIVDAHRLAEQAERNNRLSNNIILRTATAGDNASDEISDAFDERFAENLKASTRYYRDALDEHDVEVLKEMTLGQVSVLDNYGNLEQSDLARKALGDAMQSVLVSIANRDKPDVLLGKLTEARDSQKALVEVEKKADEYKDFGALKMRVATFDALTKLGSRYPDFIGDMQRRGLSDTSALRALYVGAEEILNKEGATTRQKQEAQALMDQCTALINDINAAVSPHTKSAEDDVALLKSAGTVDAKQKTEASTKLTQVFEPWKVDTRHCEDFLNEVIDAKKDDQTEWDTAKVSRSLEDSVKSSASNGGIPLKEAVANYRAGIEQDEGLSTDLKAKLFSVLDGVQAERDMGDALRSNDLTRNIKGGQAWRLFVPGNEQQDYKASKWDMEQKVRGSYAGMCRGMAEIVGQLNASGRKATGADLGKIHELAIKDNVRCEDQARLTEGFREGEIRKNLVVGQDLTPDGAIEFRDYAKDDRWFNGSNVGEIKGRTRTDKDYDEELDQADNTGKKINLSSYVVGNESKQRADDILDGLQDRYIGSKDDVTAIAGTIQDLYRSHLFNDGDTQSVVTLMTNRLLLSVNQYPTILDDPKKAMGCSVDEFVEMIREGQHRAKGELGL